MAYFCEITNAGLIGLEGADAASFLHAQLTSDVAGLSAARTQYSGYCNPQGRLLATLLVWRLEERILLQLPAVLREEIQKRLQKYILRSRVKATDATGQYVLFGIAGPGADSLVRALAGTAPDTEHTVVGKDDVYATRLPVGRYLVLAGQDALPRVRDALAAQGRPRAESAWTALDIEAGVANIGRETSEQYVPQMVNLDLIGGVSYTKGCYPGQEIVARMHYLGRLKQRMYRVRLTEGGAPQTGDRLYSPEFGAEQSSGAILNAATSEEGGPEVLAVIQTKSVAGGAVSWKALEGPAVEILSLPYSVDS